MALQGGRTDRPAATLAAAAATRSTQKAKSARVSEAPLVAPSADPDLEGAASARTGGSPRPSAPPASSDRREAKTKPERRKAGDIADEVAVDFGALNERHEGSAETRSTIAEPSAPKPTPNARGESGALAWASGTVDPSPMGPPRFEQLPTSPARPRAGSRRTSRHFHPIR